MSDKAKTTQQNKANWLYITDQSLTLLQYGMTKENFPRLTVIGHIHTEDALNNSEKHVAWVKANIKGDLNLLLSDTLYQLLLSDVPEVPADELEAAIELKAADLINFDLDDAAIDVIQFPSEAYRGRMRMAFIVATQKKPLRDWAINLIKSGIKLRVIDIEHTQLRNLSIRAQNFNESGIFHLENTRSRLILNFKKEIVLSRSFDIGLTSLINETTIDDGELEITVTEDTQSDIQIESLVLEIRRSFDYYESQLGLGAIAEINLLCDVEHEHLAKKLTEKLGTRFNLLRVEDYLNINVSQPDLDPISFYGVTGLPFRETFE